MIQVTHKQPDTWERLAEAGHLEEAAVEYVRGRDWVTLVELQRRLEAFMPVRGGIAWRCPDTRIVLWANMSPEFAALVEGLVAGKRLHVHPTGFLTYLVDGGVLLLPLAKRPPAGGYRNDHWRPVCLRVVEASAGRRGTR